MAYLYEDKELIYEKRMISLKRRIILINSTIFVSNLIATAVILFNRLEFSKFYSLILPIFLLNLVISYAMLINRDSYEQLYLAMYTSIIGIIVVSTNIFLIVKSPATYMLIYLSITLISVYKDKKAVGLGYIIIFFVSTIIHFSYIDNIVGVNSDINELSPYIYESILVIVLFVQTIRTILNENEVDKLYEQLETQKEVELKYQATIYNLLEEKDELVSYTDKYVNDETKERINKYIDLFKVNFYLKEDLNEKVDRYLNLQETKSPSKVTGKKISGYQMKKELSQFEEMSTYKFSKFFSLIMGITFRNQKNNRINEIKKFDTMLLNPDLNLELKIISFIFLYEHLRNEKPYLKSLSHEEIVEHFSKRDAKETIDKEILEFFIKNENIFREIYECKIDKVDMNLVQEVIN
ncbi:MAG: hypothetical protein K0Q49_682 [Haloplasmataceae bacterium]|jgi:hypothetical protein|nr:hypothetical protein [Haloplasmataceae bacterium]